MIGILGALDSEVERVRGLMSGAQDDLVMGFRFTRGRLGGKEAVLGKCGVGKVNAAVCCQTMLMRYSPTLVINTGVAGSLSYALDILDVVVATDAVQHDVDTTALGDPAGLVSTVNVTYFPCDAAAREGLLAAAAALGDVRARPGRIACGDQFVCSADLKKRIVENFSADACEMEGGAIAQVCYLAKTPCAILRCISDATDDSHALEYPVFVGLAAENSARVLQKFLQDLPA